MASTHETSVQSDSDGTDKLLRKAGFDLADCFYSNAWPVMRAGSQKEQGHHLTRDDATFTESYRPYLRHPHVLFILLTSRITHLSL